MKIYKSIFGGAVGVLLFVVVVLALPDSVFATIVYSGSQNVTLELQGGTAPAFQQATISIAGSQESWDDFIVDLWFDSMDMMSMLTIFTPGMGMGFGVVGMFEDPDFLVSNLGPGDMIGPDSPLINGGILYGSGEFDDEAGGYIGLKMLRGDSMGGLLTYYGSLHMSEQSNIGTSTHRVTFDSWVYDNESGTPILAGALCYPDLPNPELIWTGLEDYVGSDGKDYTRYLLSVVNWLEFPDELFEAAPDLLPCGLNTNASRTWVDIYQEDDTYIYGFCALDEAEDLTDIWFGLPKGTTPPECVYITLTDRRCDNVYTSNLACIRLDVSIDIKPGSCPNPCTPTHCQDRKPGFLRWIHRRVLKQLARREPGGRPECQLLRHTPRRGYGSPTPRAIYRYYKTQNIGQGNTWPQLPFDSPANRPLQLLLFAINALKKYYQTPALCRPC